jgi:hypothetical protein
VSKSRDGVHPFSSEHYSLCVWITLGGHRRKGDEEITRSASEASEGMMDGVSLPFRLFGRVGVWKS